jgi:hypothetical protein
MSAGLPILVVLAIFSGDLRSEMVLHCTNLRWCVCVSLHVFVRVCKCVCESGSKSETEVRQGGRDVSE